jgi:hypothetical protein
VQTVQIVQTEQTVTLVYSFFTTYNTSIFTIY